MHTTLYLLPEERKAFEALSSDLREGWTVREPEVVCYETDQELVDRYDVLTPNGVEFTSFIEQAKSVKTSEEVTKLASQLPVEELTYEQMIDLYSLLGTKIMGGLICHLLANAESDDEVEAVMTISVIRNAQFKANKSIRP